MKNIHCKYILISLWLTSIAVIPIVKMTPCLTHHQVFNNDARIYTWVFFKEWKPGLFHDDPIAEYIRKGINPIGYNILFSCLAKLGLHPLDGAHLVNFCLVLVILVSAFICGSKVGGPWAGVIAATLVVQSFGAWNRTAGAHPRAFCLPVVAALAAAWMSGRERIALALQLMSSLFNPVSYVICSLAAGIRLLLLIRKTDRVRIMAFILCHILAAGVLFFTIFSNPYGSVVGKQELQEDLHWTGVRPRYELYPFQSPTFEIARYGIFHACHFFLHDNLLSLWKQADKIGRFFEAILIIFLLGSFFATIIIVAKKNPIKKSDIASIAKPERGLLPFFLAIGILFMTSRMIPFHLYIPNRYLVYTMPFLVNITVVCIFVALLGSKPNIWKKRKRIFLTVFFLCAILAEWFRDPITGYNFDRVLPDSHKDIVKILNTLPPDSLIAATGPIADDIPLCAARRVLFSDESYQILHLSYADFIDKRIRSFLDALLSPNWTMCRNKLGSIGVTHLLIEDRLFKKPNIFLKTLRSPILDEYWQKLSNIQYSEMAFTKAPDEAIVFSNGVWKLYNIQIDERINGENFIGE